MGGYTSKVSTWNIGHALNDAVDGRVPPVVVLRSKPRNHDAATVKVLGPVFIAQQLAESEAIALDPVPGSQINSGKGSEAAVSWTIDDKGVGSLSNRPGALPKRTGKEGIKVGILLWIRLGELRKGGVQAKALDKGLNMSLAGGRVVLTAHLLRLRLQQAQGALPVQDLLLLSAVVQQVHPQPDVDTHGLEGLGTAMSVNHVVAHIPAGLDSLEVVLREERPEPVVAPCVVRRAQESGPGVSFVVDGSRIGEKVQCPAGRVEVGEGKGVFVHRHDVNKREIKGQQPHQQYKAITSNFTQESGHLDLQLI